MKILIKVFVAKCFMENFIFCAALMRPIISQKVLQNTKKQWNKVKQTLYTTNENIKSFTSGLSTVPTFI